MDEFLTIEEIETRYAPDWVLIVEPDVDEFQHVRGGKVLFHSPDRDAVWHKAFELKLGHIAVRYLGTIPDDMVFVF